ncbi:uncharacterized protein BN648_01729 [Clostridium sp. CAG:411]|jgi:hypothetical protein|nr:hypothetical protein [Lachnospiraceae bacterium]CDE43529.1 uncharacterized protein BN648_01729 [Clostridium sp. CAG:411]
MKTLYLHIGTPKTGTTSIQYFCKNNSELLAQKGFCYPLFDFKYIDSGNSRNGLFLQNAYFTPEGERDLAIEQEYFREGSERVKELFDTYDNIILSDEGIWQTAFVRTRGKDTIDRIRRIAEEGGYQVKIIVYLRPQEEYAVSWWNQLIKHSRTSANKITWPYYKKYISRYVGLDYYGNLLQLEEAFGQENIIVRRFDKKYFKNGRLLEDFLDIFGLDYTDEYEVTQEQKNTRFSDNACEVKRAINKIPTVTQKDRIYFQGLLLEVSKVSMERYPSYMMSDREIELFMKKYEEGNRMIAERYIKDGQPLFRDKKKKHIKWDRNNRFFMFDLIQFIALAFMDVNRRLDQQEAEIQELKRQLERRRFFRRR